MSMVGSDGVGVSDVVDVKGSNFVFGISDVVGIRVVVVSGTSSIVVLGNSVVGVLGI